MSGRTVLAFPALLHAAGLVAGPVASCARNPVTGKNELALVSEEREIQMGQQAAQQVAQTIGFVEDPELQSYVAGIGKRMAAKSERPNLPWEFHVVNDASVNAFALPGGFIYVTRGLLGYMNSEAELASGPDPAWTPLYQEYRLGGWQREFRLSEAIDSEHIHATMRDGVLEVRLPKSERHRPRQIPVQSA